MRYDADAYLAAISPPSIVVGGAEHVGRHLSIDEWEAFQPRRQALADDALTNAEVEQLVRDVCDAVFGAAPSPRGWRWLARALRLPRGWWAAPSIADLVVALPYNVQMGALGSFFGSVGRAFQGLPTTTAEPDPTTATTASASPSP